MMELSPDLSGPRPSPPTCRQLKAPSFTPCVPDVSLVFNSGDTSLITPNCRVITSHSDPHRLPASRYPLTPLSSQPPHHQVNSVANSESAANPRRESGLLSRDGVAADSGINNSERRVAGNSPLDTARRRAATNNHRAEYQSPQQSNPGHSGFPTADDLSVQTASTFQPSSAVVCAAEKHMLNKKRPPVFPTSTHNNGHITSSTPLSAPPSSRGGYFIAASQPSPQYHPPAFTGGHFVATSRSPPSLSHTPGVDYIVPQSVPPTAGTGYSSPHPQSLPASSVGEYLASPRADYLPQTTPHTPDYHTSNRLPSPQTTPHTPNVVHPATSPQSTLRSSSGNDTTQHPPSSVKPRGDGVRAILSAIGENSRRLDQLHQLVSQLLIRPCSCQSVPPTIPVPSTLPSPVPVPPTATPRVNDVSVQTDRITSVVCCTGTQTDPWSSDTLHRVHLAATSPRDRGCESAPHIEQPLTLSSASQSDVDSGGEATDDAEVKEKEAAMIGHPNTPARLEYPQFNHVQDKPDKTFFENVMGRVNRILNTRESTPGQPPAELSPPRLPESDAISIPDENVSPSVLVGASDRRLVRMDPVQRATLRQLQLAGVSIAEQQTGIFPGGSSERILPTQYSGEMSLQLNTLAVKYLNTNQLLPNNTDCPAMNPPHSNEKGTSATLDGSSKRPTDVTLYGISASNMSFATRTYMDKFSLSNLT